MAARREGGGRCTSGAVVLLLRACPQLLQEEPAVRVLQVSHLSWALCCCVAGGAMERMPIQAWLKAPSLSAARCPGT